MAGTDPAASGGAPRVSNHPPHAPLCLLLTLHLTAAHGRGEAAPTPPPRQAQYLHPHIFLLIFFFFWSSSLSLSPSRQQIYTVVFTYSLGPRLPRNLAGRPAAEPTFSGALPKRKKPRPSRAPGALRAGSWRAALPRRRRRGGGGSGQRPLQLGGEQTSTASGSLRGHPALLRLLPTPQHPR